MEEIKEIIECKKPWNYPEIFCLNLRETKGGNQANLTEDGYDNTEGSIQV